MKKAPEVRGDHFFKIRSNGTDQYPLVLQSIRIQSEHPIGCKQQPIGCSVEAVATVIGCLSTQALAFSPVSIQTQRTQRKRLRLDGIRASL